MVERSTRAASPRRRAANRGSFRMQSTIVTKAEKARRYALELDRLRIGALEATFEAGGGTHVLRLGEAGWSCDCEFFVANRVCPHVEAASRMLDAHLVESAKPRVVDLLAGA
jgi:hypothetical protein